MSRPTVDGVDAVRVSAVVSNVGGRAGSDVAQLYLGDPAATGEPPRQLVGYQRVMLAPGQSTGVRFTVTPRDTWWWDQAAGGWNQSTGRYGLYVGDSSALANLPLRGAFAITATPGARQVVIHAPSTMSPGKPSIVTVQLTASGNETLRHVVLSLQLPGGFTVQPVGPTTFGSVSPSQAPVAKFRVTPAAWVPATNAVVHATADLSPTAQREAGVTVTVG